MLAYLLWLVHAATVLAGLVAGAWVLGWLAMVVVRRALIGLWRRRAAHLPGLVLAALLALLAGWGIAGLYREGYDALVPDGTPYARLWRDILSVLAPGLALGLGLVRLATMLRQWRQLVPSGPFERATPGLGDPPPRVAAGRRIVILCDGTRNRPDMLQDGRPAPTNIWKLHQMLRNDETQTVWYLAGVGTGTSSASVAAGRVQSLLDAIGAGIPARLAGLSKQLLSVWEAAVGGGLEEAATRAYAEIVRQYRPGDRIYLIGFSRGAYTARAVAGIIRRCGLLSSGNILYAPNLVRLHLARRNPEHGVPVAPALVWPAVDVEFLGVFDTVAALGAPLWGWWFTLRGILSQQAFNTDPAPICRGVYHAMAMDERRAQFFPTAFDDPGRRHGWTERFEQTWFRGGHGDVGGGYADSALSDIALGWMLRRAEAHGLSVLPGARETMRPWLLGRIHDTLALQPAWGLTGSWPRWTPVPGEDPLAAGVPGTLDPTVLERAAASMERLGRPDLLRLAPGEAVEILTEAHRNWDRTGLVVEAGAAYRITWLGGRWRDGAGQPCGPAGQPARRFDPRRLLFRRRLGGAPWMALCATVAHRRRWPLRELGLQWLLAYLFWRDPAELREQVAPIGVSLRQEGAALCLVSNAPAGGLLYLFANDWWQAAPDNSGGLRLRVERLAAPDPALPCWVLNRGGTWSRAVSAP